MWSRLISHILLVGMEDAIATLENNLTVSYKVKRTLPCDPAILLLFTSKF